MKNTTIKIATAVLMLSSFAACKKQDSIQPAKTIKQDLVLSRRAASTLHITSVSIGAVHGPTKNISCGFACPYIYDKANVTVADGNGVPVSGVTVTGSFSGCYTLKNQTGVTDANGFAYLIGRKGKTTCTVTFQVTNLSLSGYSYDANSNVAVSATYTPPAY